MGYNIKELMHAPETYPNKVDSSTINKTEINLSFTKAPFFNIYSQTDVQMDNNTHM